MPTLGGLLKKKKTHSIGSRESPSTGAEAATATVSDHHNNDKNNKKKPSSSSDAEKLRRQSTKKDSSDTKTDSSHSTTANKPTPSDTPMTSTAPSAHSSAQAASPSTTQQQQQQYTQGIGSINSLINPPQQQQHHGQDAATIHAQQQQQAVQFQTAKTQPRQTKGKYSLEDFSLQRTLGTGSFGRVHLVQSKHNHRFYAVKVLKKAQVVKMKQVEHTNDERRMLQRVKHPFLITLWGTFQDSKNLYMVMDFVEGGELFSLLRKSQVRGILAYHIVVIAILIHADPHH